MNNIQDLISSQTIVRIIRDHLGIEVKQTGRNFFMVCPFHDERTPSLSFESVRKFFKCFSCEFKAGSFFKFWAKFKKREWTSFRETVKEVYELVDPDEKEKIREFLSTVSGYYDDSAQIRSERRAFSSEIVRKTSEIYHNNLWSRSEGLEYLRARGVKEEAIREFSLGLTTYSKQVFNCLSKNKWSEPEILASKLVTVNQYGNISDFFLSGQITFPIKNEHGKHVSIASRSLQKNEGSKYIFLGADDSTDRKSSILYNYENAIQQKTEECYLVEGFFDVISLWQEGFKNCVGLLGTSLSKNQLALLRRLGKKIVVFMDGDKAGIEASINISIQIIKEGLPCLVVTNDWKRDPDEICRNGNISEVIHNKRTVVSYVVFLCAQLSKYEGGVATLTLVDKVIHYLGEDFISKHIDEITDEIFPYCAPVSLEDWLAVREKLSFFEKQENRSFFTNGQQTVVERSILYHSFTTEEFWETVRGFFYYSEKHKVIKESIEEFYRCKKENLWNESEQLVKKNSIREQFPLVLDGKKYGQKIIPKEELAVHINNRRWKFVRSDFLKN